VKIGSSFFISPTFLISAAVFYTVTENPMFFTLDIVKVYLYSIILLHLFLGKKYRIQKNKYNIRCLLSRYLESQLELSQVPNFNTIIFFV